MKALSFLLFGSCLAACQSQIPLGNSDLGGADASPDGTTSAIDGATPPSDGGAPGDPAGDAEAGSPATPEVVATLLAFESQLVTDGTNLYLGPGLAEEAGPIYVVPLNGGPPFPLDYQVGTAIAIDDTNIYSVNVDMTTTDAGLIQACAKTGCNAYPTLIASGPAGAWDLAVDGANVYWTDIRVTGGGVLRSPLDGGATVALASTPASIMALAGGFVYFVDAATGESLMRVPEGGGDAAVFASAPSALVSEDAGGSATIVALATDSANVYYATAGGGIVRAPIDGSPQTILAPQTSDGSFAYQAGVSYAPYQIAVGGGYVYWPRAKAIGSGSIATSEIA